MKKLLSLLFCIMLFISLLCGCSSTSEYDDSYDSYDSYNLDSYDDSSTENNSYNDYDYEDYNDYNDYNSYDNDNDDYEMEEFIREQLGDGAADAYSEGENRWNSMIEQYDQY